MIGQYKTNTCKAGMYKTGFIFQYKPNQSWNNKEFGFLNSLPPEIRRVARQVGGTLKRSIPIGKVFGGKVFPPLTF